VIVAGLAGAVLDVWEVAVVCEFIRDPLEFSVMWSSHSQVKLCPIALAGTSRDRGIVDYHRRRPPAEND
jgi:hypothetical protein